MIRIRLLGGLSVQRDDQRVPAPSATQPRRLAILATIAQAGDRGVSRDRLHTLLWPEADEDTARRGLTQALYALRTGLDEERLFVGVQELRLNRDVATCDVTEYATAIEEGELERAAGLYRGPLLDGFRVPGVPDFDRRVEEQRDELARKHESLIERLAVRATKHGEHDRAAEWWRQRAAMDPWSARVAEAYMRALVAAGDRTGAIRHARVHEQLVVQEFGTEASASVVALAEQIRMETEAAIAPSAGAVEASVRIADPPKDALAVAAKDTVADTAADTVADAVPSTPAPAASVSPVHIPAVQVAPPRASRARAPWLVAGGVLLTTITALLVWNARASATRRLDDIELATLRVSAPQRIAADAAFELDPAISPDGRHIAYVAGEEGTMRLFVRQRDGGQAIPIAESVAGDHRRPRWSPDGASLVFQSGGGIWIVPALGGSARAALEPATGLAIARSPIWSPSGQELAWIARDTIFRMAAGGGARVAIGHVQQGHSLTWSPDGSWIAAVSGNEAFDAGARADHARAGFGIGNLAPSAIVLVPVMAAAEASGDHAMRRMETLVAPTTLNASPAWIDRRSLVFVSNRGGTRDVFGVHINDDGTLRGDVERITAGLDVHSVSASADGMQLAYAVFRQSSNVWSVPISLTAPAALATATRVTSGTQVVEGLEVSLDGRWLAYDADVNGQQDIFRLPLSNGAAAASNAERIVASPLDDFHPSWSPDGRWISFYTFNGNVRRAAVVPSSGGPWRLVHPDGPNVEEHSPVWSPDGRSLFYFRTERAQTDLHRANRLSDTAWSPNVRVTRAGGLGASFSADGRQMAYFSAPGKVHLTDSTFTEAASRMLLSPAAARDGAPLATSGRIAPDGTGLIVKGYDDTSSGFWWYPLNGGEIGAPRVLLRFDDRRRASPRPEFGLDARYLYFTLSEREADVWALQIERR